MFTWELRARLGSGATASLQRPKQPFASFSECEADFITKLDILNLDAPDCTKGLLAEIIDTKTGKRYRLSWRKMGSCKAVSFWHMLGKIFGCW